MPDTGADFIELPAEPSADILDPGQRFPASSRWGRLDGIRQYVLPVLVERAVDYVELE